MIDRETHDRQAAEHRYFRSVISEQAAELAALRAEVEALGGPVTPGGPAVPRPEGLEVDVACEPDGHGRLHVRATVRLGSPATGSAALSGEPAALWWVLLDLAEAVAAAGNGVAAALVVGGLLDGDGAGS